MEVALCIEEQEGTFQYGGGRENVDRTCLGTDAGTGQRPVQVMDQMAWPQRPVTRGDIEAWVVVMRYPWSKLKPQTQTHWGLDGGIDQIISAQEQFQNLTAWAECVRRAAFFAQRQAPAWRVRLCLERRVISQSKLRQESMLNPSRTHPSNRGAGGCLPTLVGQERECMLTRRCRGTMLRL